MADPWLERDPWANRPSSAAWSLHRLDSQRSDKAKDEDESSYEYYSDSDSELPKTQLENKGLGEKRSQQTLEAKMDSNNDAKRAKLAESARDTGERSSSPWIHIPDEEKPHKSAAFVHFNDFRGGKQSSSEEHKVVPNSQIKIAQGKASEANTTEFIKPDAKRPKLDDNQNPRTAYVFNPSAKEFYPHYPQMGIGKIIQNQIAHARQRFLGEREKNENAEQLLATETKKLEAAEKQCKSLQEQVNTLLEEKAKLNEELQTEKSMSSMNPGLDKQCAALKEQLRVMSEENEKLKAQLQVQKSVTGLSQGACWKFETDGGWEAFTREGNEEMHQAYLEFLKKNKENEDPDSRYVTITSGGVARVVDFQEMTQKHRTTKKVRNIRFLPGSPRQWVTAPADLLLQGNDLSSFYKKVTDFAICQSITDILRNTGHSWDKTEDCHCMKRAKLISVHRIENFYLWHRYKAKLAAMRQDHARFGISVGSADLDLDGSGDKILTGYQEMLDCQEPLVLDVDEKILLHGTSWHSANSIVREGFDHRTCQHGFYGSGVYFACAACKSHQYTCEQHKKCCKCKSERTLIIARVALGDAYIATETRQKERRPPLRSDSSGTHDSIVVKPGPIQGHHNFDQVHQEYVVCHNEQAYPCYVVQYTV